MAEKRGTAYNGHDARQEKKWANPPEAAAERRPTQHSAINPKKQIEICD
jgi:hypothetical protein